MSTIDRNWGWQRSGVNILLYEINGDDKFIPPSLDVTDGLKIEYISGGKVFIDSEGFSDDSSPDENSILNCQNSICYAIIYYIKARLAEAKIETAQDSVSLMRYRMNMEYYDKKFEKEFRIANAKLDTEPRIGKTIRVYAIR